jgi:hypothetical protein
VQSRQAAKDDDHGESMSMTITGRWRVVLEESLLEDDAGDRTLLARQNGVPNELLGATSFIADRHFHPGERITVTGEPGQVGDQPVLFIESVDEPVAILASLTAETPADSGTVAPATLEELDATSLSASAPTGGAAEIRGKSADAPTPAPATPDAPDAPKPATRKPRRKRRRTRKNR